MRKLKPLGIVFGLSVVMLIGVADTASAAKKPHLTYDQAWARCKVHVDKLAADHQSQRYSRGSACMHAYGYRI